MFVETVMRVLHSFVMLGLSVALGSGGALLAVDDHPFAKQATDLLTRLDVRAQNFKRNVEAVDEPGFLLETHSALIHKTRLNMLKEDVSRMGELVTQLIAIAALRRNGRRS